MDRFEPSPRSKVRRQPQRGFYDKKTLFEILDEGFVAHVGFVQEGAPLVIPMIYGRRGEDIFLHGASVSRLMNQLEGGLEVCLTVTLVDGLVLARSAFHHSMNYRSAVIFGKAKKVADPAAKTAGLKAISDHLMAGRWDEVRAPNPKELGATTLLAVKIDDGSAKIRTGPPKDDEPDYELNVWAGVLPLSLKTGEPEPDPRLKEGIEPSERVSQWKKDA